jgi:1,4-alpha-glucan branching enzyme
MYPRRSQTQSTRSRYSAKNIAKPVNFVCLAPDAKRVSLIGDFNAWQSDAHPMKLQPDGAWLVQVELSHGHHRYLFYVDGQKRLDPRAHGIARNETNEKVSLLAIS